jgi:hypothetical protein
MHQHTIMIIKLRSLVELFVGVLFLNNQQRSSQQPTNHQNREKKNTSNFVKFA